MTEEELKKLRTYYHSLLGIQRIFQNASDNRSITIEGTPVNILEGELRRIEADFPGLLEPFTDRNFLSDVSSGRPYFRVEGILAYLASALARLKVEIDVPESTPVTETREFSFINDPELRRVLERDYGEIQRAYIAKCWKSVIILSGGAIEAILTDLLLQDPSRAKAATKAPSKPDITRWDLAELINVSVELGLISPGAEKLSHPVREYRNLVHPGNEIRSGLTFDAEEARIALEVLHIIHRDLYT
jgi:hypothetical protein